MPANTNCPAAQFITFEGIDGCGKSTLLDHLGRCLEEVDCTYIKTREPGGTPIGENIRKILLDPANNAMHQMTEVLLYTASRAQLTREVIMPALKRGIWVLADRYIDATLAYQGYGRGLDRNHLRQIQEWATAGLWPHYTILLDCDPDVAWERMRTRQGRSDRIERENRAFHEQVRQGYLSLAAAEPQRFIVLDATKVLEAVLEDFNNLFWRSLLPTPSTPAALFS